MELGGYAKIVEFLNQDQKLENLRIFSSSAFYIKFLEDLLPYDLSVKHQRRGAERDL